MANTYLLTTENDPLGIAVDKLLGDTPGYRWVAPGEFSSADVEPADTLLLGDFDQDIAFPAQGFVQFLNCQPSSAAVGRIIDSGAVVAGISPAISARVANRVAGFGGPLRVKPGADWGVIGLGEVGSEVVRKLTGARGSANVIIAEVRTPRSGALAELGVRRQTIDLLIAGSDAVSIHVRSGPTASPLISERELNLMKDGAVLINTSDSSVVDEEAVLESLSIGPLAGYATDVPGEIIANADESLVSSGKLFVTTNPLTNQIGAAQQIARYVQVNVTAFSDGSDIQGILEPVDFPTIGDPSFWSSMMSPRQD
jgi:hypothetical protein